VNFAIFFYVMHKWIEVQWR